MATIRVSNSQYESSPFQELRSASPPLTKEIKENNVRKMLIACMTRLNPLL